jgi:hypothetical protein
MAVNRAGQDGVEGSGKAIGQIDPRVKNMLVWIRARARSVGVTGPKDRPIRGSRARLIPSASVRVSDVAATTSWKVDQG